MARQEENYHAQAQAVAWEYLIGYSVEDENGEKIGTVKALWEDFTRQPAYLGIATSWLDMGRIHVVPAHYATVSERKKRVRLPFSAEIVKHAPECHASDEITLRGETKIRDYFHREGVATDFNAELAATQNPAGHAPQPESAGKGSPATEPDWSPQAREKEQDKSAPRREVDETIEEEPEADDGRSLKERISEAVERGKAEFKQDRDEDRPSYLRKIYPDQPVAAPVLPREENREYSESIRQEREEDSFVPMRKEAMDAERRRLRRGNDRDELPLR